MLACGLTDGSILLYGIVQSETKFKFKLLLTLSDVHGFGVNFIDTLVLDDKRFLVASGGDDQNISVSLFEKSDDTSITRVSHCTSYAHSSCVKGL